MARRLYLPMVWVALFDVAVLALVAGLLHVWLG